MKTNWNLKNKCLKSIFFHVSPYTAVYQTNVVADGHDLNPYKLKILYVSYFVLLK